MSTQTSQGNSATTSAASSQKPRFKLVNIVGATIPVEITEELQNQITFHCQQVDGIEWSGTLFFTTEGVFGDADFKITAKGMFLQDIGTQGYTEYDYEPEYFKFLMQNPAMMDMLKGHIHSHHSMKSYFSSVDESELTDNAPNYNFYLSVIVNNRNEIVGKVAFLADSKREEKVTLTFKGVEGVEGKTEISKCSEEKAVFAYDCKIITPERVGDSFRARVTDIKKTKEAERIAKATAAAQQKALSGNKSGTAYGGFNVNQKWDEAKSSTKSADKGDWEDWEDKVIPPVSRSTAGVDGRVYDLLVKLVSLDINRTGTLSKALKEVNDRLYSEERPAHLEMLTTYFDKVENSAINFYIETFPEDFHLRGFDSTFESCVEILESYEGEFPDLIDPLMTCFNITIEDEIPVETKNHKSGSGKNKQNNKKQNNKNNNGNNNGNKRR